MALRGFVLRFQPAVEVGLLFFFLQNLQRGPACADVYKARTSSFFKKTHEVFRANGAHEFLRLWLEVPAVDGAAHIFGDLPDAALKFGALLNTRHAETL